MMLTLVYIATASAASFALGGRLAYGCWFWEWRKTWYWTHYAVRMFNETNSLEHCA